MDIEQLKLILETVNAAGEGAKTIAILYLAISVIPSLLKTLALIVCAVVLSKMIQNIASLVNVGHRVAEALGVEVTGCWITDDSIKVLARCRELVDMEQRQKGKSDEF